ncbi:unnamed protein product [Ilex paraguariensis]|uniref:Uncharacterized protein n=1 Tax=Ilex paraguariensis TaxID=185542 RepID=A0ABC8RIT9_9AQUA
MAKDSGFSILPSIQEGSRKPKSDITNLISAFDVGTEEYRLVPQPEYADKNFHMNVEVLGGCLCLLCNYYPHHIDVWVMKDYGVKESFEFFRSIAYS